VTRCVNIGPNVSLTVSRKNTKNCSKTATCWRVASFHLDFRRWHSWRCNSKTRFIPNTYLLMGKRKHGWRHRKEHPYALGMRKCKKFYFDIRLKILLLVDGRRHQLYGIVLVQSQRQSASYPWSYRHLSVLEAVDTAVASNYRNYLVFLTLVNMPVKP